jgi:hypothetical protein
LNQKKINKQQQPKLKKNPSNSSSSRKKEMPSSIGTEETRNM